MKREYKVLVLHLTLLIVAASLLSYFVKPDHGNLHMSLAGFFIGTYAMFGKEVAKIGIGSLLARKVPRFDVDWKANAMIIVALFVLSLAGLLAWIVSWEATTGVRFGFAVFISALLSDYGLSPFFAEYIPLRAKPTQ